MPYEVLYRVAHEQPVIGNIYAKRVEAPASGLAFAPSSFRGEGLNISQIFLSAAGALVFEQSWQIDEVDDQPANAGTASVTKAFLEGYPINFV
jgi:hypothetical protein